MKYKALCFFLVSNTLSALTEMPWFYPPFECQFGAVVDPNFFRDVKDGFNPVRYHSNNVLAEVSLLVPITEAIDIETELTLQKSSKYSFGFESVALQGRMQFLDDLSGDPVSLDAGLNVRIVSGQRLRDVATPYHNLANFELTGAVGKEWSSKGDFVARSYLTLGVGEAIRGYPWVRFFLRGEVKPLTVLSFNGFLRGYFGTGPENHVNVSKFSSYAFIQHQNIDVGGGATWFFRLYGELSFNYAIRLFAHAFPDKYQSFCLSYTIPFSL
jgi:hypothetical protein